MNLSSMYKRVKQVSTFLFLFFLVSPLIFAQTTTDQTHKRCGTDEYLQNLIEKDPSLRLEVEKLEEETQKAIAEAANNPSEKAAEVYTIPVVVHVVWYSGDERSNISDEQIYSQIDVLNEDFRRKNEDTTRLREIFADRAADIEIEFCLASQDPDGNPTDGITRKSIDIASFESEDDLMKFSSTGGVDAWPTSDYLNIWVVNNIEGGVLGYAQPLAAFSSRPNQDGLVVAHWVFGRIGTSGTVIPTYNKGRTMTHEAGHWLNLNHPWGSGNESTTCAADDGVADTPRTMEPNFVCSTSANQCFNEVPDLPDMIENYMDYTTDACCNTFTEGQKTRARDLFGTNGRRASLLSSQGCVELIKGENNAAIINVINPPPTTGLCPTFEPAVEIRNHGIDSLYLVSIAASLEDSLIYDQTIYFFEEPLGTFDARTFTLPQVNTINTGFIHNISFKVTKPNGVADFDTLDNVVEHTFVVRGPGLVELNEDFEGTDFPPNNKWNIVNEDEKQTFEATKLAASDGFTSAYINNFNYVESLGTKDELHIPDLDLKANFQAYLTFNVAYTNKEDGSQTDTLEVLISNDCGETPESYVSIYKASGEDLVTAPATNENFVPTNAQWQAVSIDLSPYVNMSNAAIKFVQTRGDGNNLYLDQIRTNNGIVSVRPIANHAINEVNIYPNPTQGQINVSFQTSQNEPTKWTLIDHIGRLIYQDRITTQIGENQFNFRANDLPTGIYFLQLQNGLETITKKVLVTVKK